MPAHDDQVTVYDVFGGQRLAAVLATALVGGVLVVGSLVVPAAAGAASDAPTGDVANSLHAVSCTSPASCVAVGIYSSRPTARTLVQAWDGASWSVVPSPSPGRGYYNVLNGVSCASAVRCIAVGDYDSPSDNRTLVEAWDGVAWSVVPSPSPGSAVQLVGVSCTGANFCVAVGSYGTLAAGSQTLVESWDGSAWTVVPSPNPEHGALFNAVSCASPISCIAVGDMGDALTGYHSLAESWNGSAWTAVPSPNPGTTSGTNVFTGVSCASATSCVAVGYSGHGTSVQPPFVASWDGAHWSVVPSPSPGTINFNVLYSVSCAGPSTCTAVGSFGPAADVSQGFIEAWGGASWALADSPRPSGSSSRLAGVSCTGPAHCVAVGSHQRDPSPGGSPAGVEGSLIESWDGSTWSIAGSPDATMLVAPVVGMAATPAGDGYVLADAGGDVVAYGGARMVGSLAGRVLNAPIVSVVATRDGQGYWLTAADGGVFSFGDAHFYGSMGDKSLHAPVVGMATTTSGLGYWLVAADGGIFAYGDAAFAGSMGGTPLNQPVVGMSADRTTGGYWEVASDGGVFAFGAPFLGSLGAVRLDRPMRAMASTPDGNGYRLAAGDGGVFAYGDAAFLGSMGGMPLNAPVVGMSGDPSSDGYWLVASDGGIFSFGAPFYGA